MIEARLLQEDGKPITAGTTDSLGHLNLATSATLMERHVLRLILVFGKQEIVSFQFGHYVANLRIVNNTRMFSQNSLSLKKKQRVLANRMEVDVF
jgi:hypothetical protein